MKEGSQTIFDPLRRKYVKFTPEESVRQWAIGFLRDVVKVPEGLMMSEYAFKYNSLTYRSDIVVFDRRGEMLMFVECKAPEVELDREVMDQVARYNITFKARYIMVTNGRISYICKLNAQSGSYDFLGEAPLYEEMTK